MSPSLIIYSLHIKVVSEGDYGPVSSSSVLLSRYKSCAFKRKKGERSTGIIFSACSLCVQELHRQPEGAWDAESQIQRERDRIWATKRDRVLRHTHIKDFGLWFYHLFSATRGFIVEHCSLLFPFSNKQNFPHFLQGNLSWNGWGRVWPESDFSEETPFGWFFPNLSKTGTSGQ